MSLFVIFLPNRWWHYLVVSATVMACNQVPFDQESKRFRTYLSNTFGIDLASETSYWLILPGKGCGQCSAEVIERFAMTKDSLQCLHLVTVGLDAYDFHLSELIRPRERVYIDVSDGLMRLNLGVPVASLIIVQDQRIVDIWEIVPESLEEVWGKLGACPQDSGSPLMQ